MVTQKSFKVTTPGRGMINVTAQVLEIVVASKIVVGICNIFLHHTSASIIICENADVSVQRDMEVFMGHLVPDGDNLFSHVAEGPDDMPSHVRTILTQSALTIPVSNQVLDLGVWQGIYLWEHRLQTHTRKITVSVLGE
ncbi:MAG: secondary thiamine-phosphate synthase enzyme YjbQ [Gammaproteobacteria bacterium]|nr:secondary thiamine-phosphate synthase enzyme YjbQ [Gammaproteobacteria bacterium]